MKKRFIEILLVICCFNLFGNSTKEISESVTQLNSGEWFSWESGEYNSLDSTYMVKDGIKTEEPINYLKLSFKSDGEEFKKSFVLDSSRRISINVKSATGAKISLIDRMAGVLKSSGIIGDKDGRIDIDLDAGEYLVVVSGVDREEISLNIDAYYNINSNKERDFFLNSLPGEYLSLSLRDFEQRSFWIRVDSSNKFYFEALGRNLNGASVWKDGLYKVDVNYNLDTREVEKGRPLTFIEYSDSLAEGFYLIKLYGGVENLWSVEKKENPLYVRSVQETIIGGGIKNIVISPFGNDNFFIKNANYFFAYLKDKADLTVKVGRGGYTTRYRSSYTSSIKYDSYDKSCNLNVDSIIKDGNYQVIGKPGTKIKVGAFINSSAAVMQINDKDDGSKRYWISGLNPENPDNSVDLIPLLQNRNRTIVKSGFINISPDLPFYRSYNLDGYFSYFVNVEESGNYVIQELGDETNGRATFYIKNFINFNESDEEELKSGDSVRLTKGYYILTVYPDKYGIHEFVLFSKPLTAISSKALLKEAEKIKNSGSFNSVSSFNWPEVELNHKSSGNNYTEYNLIFNSRKNKILNIRELPMDLRENYLPFVLAPKEAVTLELKVTENSKLIVNGEDFEILDSKGKYPGLLTTGTHSITVKNIGNKSQLYSVGTDFSLTYKSFKSPKHSDLSQVLTKIDNNVNIFDNYDWDDTKSYLLEVDKPGLYRLETTGRLRTGITIRTPNITKLFSEYENGVGRNALINEFLRPGQYIVEVSTRGDSKGRASTILRKNDLTVTKELAAEDILREKVPGGHALKVPINIKEKGNYYFSSYLFNNSANLRFEDSNGWPLFISNGPTSDFSSNLDVGKYNFYSMPKDYESRRVTSFYMETEFPKGYMPLNGYINDTWFENEDRTPLQYKFSFSSDHTGEIHFYEDLEVWITDDNGVKVNSNGDSRSIKFDLGKGEYLLNVRTIEPDNKRDVNLEIYTNEISQDNSRYVYSTGKYSISVGKDSLVDIWSVGSNDVSAKLYNENGLISFNDDAPNDWNFFISENLKKGKYSLDVEGDRYTGIKLKERSIKDNGFVKLPFSKEIELNDEAQRYEITIKGEVKPFIVETKSDKDVFISIFNKDRVIDQGINRIAVPLGEGSYNVQILQRSSGVSNTSLDILTPKLTKVDFNKIGNINTKAAILKNSEDINYYLTGDDLLYSSGEGRPFEEIGELSVNCHKGVGYLLSNNDVIGDVNVKQLEINSGNGATVNTYIDDTGFFVKNNKGRISILSASSPGSTIGMALNSERVNWNHSWVSNTKSLVAILPQGDFKTKVWNGDKTDVNTGIKSVEKEINRVIDFNKPLSINVDKKEVIKINVPKGDVSLITSKGILTSIWMGDVLISSYYGENDDISFTVPKGDYQLAVVNMSNREGLIKVENGTGTESVKYINSKKSYESYLTNSSTMDFIIGKLRDNEVLNIYGDLSKIEVYANSGEYLEISSFNDKFSKIDRGGKVKIEADIGLLKVWISKESERDLFFASNDSKLSRDKLKIGENRISKDVESWQLQVDKPSYISLKSDNGGVLSILDSGKLLEHCVGTYPEGRSLYYYLNPGKYTVIARSSQGLNQSGNLYYSSNEATMLIEGGLENEIFIESGESHIYKFSVKYTGKVGAGVQSNKDYLNAQVYDNSFNLISSGAINFMTLEVGDYFMVVTSDIDTVRYRPVVYGIDGSIREIPEEVLKQYR